MDITDRAIRLGALILIQRDYRCRVNRIAQRFALPPQAVRQLHGQGTRSILMLAEVFDPSPEMDKRSDHRA